MRLCKSCGSAIPDGCSFCTACGAKAIDTYEFSGQSKKPGNSPNDGTQGVLPNEPGSYSTGRRSTMPALSEGELVVKSYNCARMVRPNCEGYITVTNRRVIFHADADKSHISSEVYLDSVSGMTCLTGNNYRIGLMILGIIVAIFGFVRIIQNHSSPVINLLCILVGVLFVFLSIRKTYRLSILSSKANESPIALGEGAKAMLGNSAVLSLQCEPTDETYTMIHELGALILDLQSMGDHAIEKWQRTGERR